MAGGKGTRLLPLTQDIPKPMIKIGGIPILEHIMNCYSRFGFYEFVLCGGYKIDIIKDYFLKINNYKSDVFIDFENENVLLTNKKINKNWKIWIVNTGLNSQTGHRLFKIKKFLKSNEDFFMTYGDGLSNVNIKKLLKFHKKNKKMATMTIVRPQARFGHIKLSGNLITKFREKDQISEGWINGGFFVLNQKIFKYLKGKPMSPKGENWDKALEYWHTLKSDKDANFDKELTLDGSQIKPMVTWGTSPQDVVEIDGKVPSPENETDPDRKNSINRSLN